MRVFDLHIALLDVTPAVWRRVRVPADLPLADLHRVIQVVMNWHDVRPHVFDIGGREYGPAPDEEEISLHWAGDDVELTVASAAATERIFEYTYDFGSEHRIEIKVLGESSADRARIECVEGEGIAPSEGAAPRHMPTVFSAVDANRRLADEFRAERPVAGRALDEDDKLLADLILLVLFLGSWQEKDGAHVAWKTVRFEILDALGEDGLIVTNTHRKSVVLTSDGVKRARELLRRVAPLLEHENTK